MNEMKKSADASASDSDREVKRLSAIIQENRAALEKGWAELARLDQMLTSSPADEARADSAENPSASGTEPTDPENPSSVVVVKE